MRAHGAPAVIITQVRGGEASMRGPSLETEVDKALDAGSIQWRGWVGSAWIPVPRGVEAWRARGLQLASSPLIDHVALCG